MKSKFSKLIVGLCLLAVTGAGILTVTKSSNQNFVSSNAVTEAKNFTPGAGTIEFGRPPKVRISSVNYGCRDNLNNNWTIVTVPLRGSIPTSGFNYGDDYSQIGNNQYPANTITFTLNFSHMYRITYVEVQFAFPYGTATDIFYAGYNEIKRFPAHSSTARVIDKTDDGSYVDATNLRIELNSNGSGFAVQCCYIKYTIEEIPDNPIQTFINNYMHMGEDVQGQCNTYYGPAKEAFNALEGKDQEKFLTEEQYKSAADRFRAWARAHGDMYSKKDGGFIHDPTVYNNIVENNITIIAVSASVALVTIVTVLVIAIKKRKKA